MSNLFLEVPRLSEITSFRGRIRSELIEEDGTIFGDAIVIVDENSNIIGDTVNELIKEVIYYQLNFDYETIAWAYDKLNACLIGASNQDSTFMMDRLKQIIMEA